MDKKIRNRLKEVNASFVRMANNAHEMWKMPTGGIVVLSTAYSNPKTTRNQLKDIEKALKI